MHPDERRRRMRKMREAVEENNVYRWAVKFLSALADIEFPEYTTERPAAFQVAV
jgi:trehalose-6-phosphate synthase